MRIVLLMMTGAMALAGQALQPPPLVPVDKLKIPKSEEGVTDADQPQASSISGNALFGLKDKDGKALAALAAIEKDPTNAELRLAAGRIQDSLLRFMDSTATYSDGVEKFPKDYRFLKMRGHRNISLRKFSAAVADLEKASRMAPNSFDVAYYLGLAYYFNGDHAKAAAALGACEDQTKTPVATKADLMGGRACESLASDPNWLVPLQYWRYMAIRRAGDSAGAKKYVESVKADLVVNAAKPFYETLLFFKGAKEINEMLAGVNEGTRDSLTRSTAAATWLFTEGERAQACSLWARAAMDQNWDHLGVINAESEYYQNSKAACSLYGAPPKQN